MLKRVDIGQDNAKLEGFDLFWAVYPRKVAKLEAMRAWNATKKIHPPIEELIAAVRKLQLSTDDIQFCPHPATWLRGGRWLDE